MMNQTDKPEIGISNVDYWLFQLLSVNREVNVTGCSQCPIPSFE